MPLTRLDNILPSSSLGVGRVCAFSSAAVVSISADCSDPDAVPEEWTGCCDADYPKTVQERAWTSPIWFTPERTGLD